MFTRKETNPGHGRGDLWGSQFPTMAPEPEAVGWEALMGQVTEPGEGVHGPAPTASPGPHPQCPTPQGWHHRRSALQPGPCPRRLAQPQQPLGGTLSGTRFSVHWPRRPAQPRLDSAPRAPGEQAQQPSTPVGHHRQQGWTLRPKTGPGVTGARRPGVHSDPRQRRAGTGDAK